jgi:hypothetical protein
LFCAVLRVQDVIDPDPDPDSAGDRGANSWGLNRLLRGRQKEARRPRDEEEEVEGRSQADFSDNVGLTVLMPGGMKGLYV